MQGLAVPVGVVLPMNLRRLGVWGDIARSVLLRRLVPCAALFATRVQDDAALGVLRLKRAVGVAEIGRAHV